MTERFAYLAFLAVVGCALLLMTAGLAITLVVLLRQNRKLKQPHRPERP